MALQGRSHVGMKDLQLEEKPSLALCLINVVALLECLRSRTDATRQCDLFEGSRKNRGTLGKGWGVVVTLLEGSIIH